MNVHQFMQSGQPRWRQLDEFIQKASRLTLHRAPLDEFREGSLLYRQTVSDLAYARMKFSQHAVVGHLEQLLARAHSVVYQAQPVKRAGWREFWLRTWPILIVGAWKEIGFATLIFTIASIAGFILASLFPALESSFISPGMRAAMDDGRLWTESITKMAPQASSRITTNNISVCILAWALGATFGLGTVWLLVTNGLMLGVVFAACLKAGLLLQIVEFIVAHGALELPAIWISAGAGLILGNALLFPGRYSRSAEFRLAGVRSVQILVGTIPMLLIAGFVEGFVSPSNLPGSMKVALAVSLFLAYLTYIVIGSRPVSAELPATANRLIPSTTPSTQGAI